jgi:putative membrane protein (TIGR04086 family)
MKEKFHMPKNSSNYLISIIKTVAISLIITFIILLGASLLLCFTDFPDKYTLPAAIVGTILGVFTGAAIASGKNPEKPMVSALLTAFLYSVLSFVTGCILEGRVKFTLNTLLFTIIALLTGAIASILVSSNKKSNKYGRKPLKLPSIKKKPGTKNYSFSKGVK